MGHTCFVGLRVGFCAGVFNGRWDVTQQPFFCDHCRVFGIVALLELEWLFQVQFYHARPQITLQYIDVIWSFHNTLNHSGCPTSTVARHPQTITLPPYALWSTVNSSLGVWLLHFILATNIFLPSKPKILSLLSSENTYYFSSVFE